MICTLSARRLKPSDDVFSGAWGGGDERPAETERWRRIYHCRDVEDENVIISFGFF